LIDGGYAMSEVYLELPSKSREQDAKAYLREVIGSGSPINGMGELDEYDDYDKWLVMTHDFHEGKNLPDDWVRSSEYFLVRAEDDRIVGMMNIRHEQNDFLIEHGYGHIGYGIRPSERRQGYATKILALALGKCKELGIDEVHVGCLQDNIGSMKTIRRNGGVLYKKLVNDGQPYVEFVIEQ
jgi:predicted acetyltransferase